MFERTSLSCFEKLADQIAVRKSFRRSTTSLC